MEQPKYTNQIIGLSAALIAVWVFLSWVNIPFFANLSGYDLISFGNFPDVLTELDFWKLVMVPIAAGINILLAISITRSEKVNEQALRGILFSSFFGIAGLYFYIDMFMDLVDDEFFSFGYGDVVGVGFILGALMLFALAFLAYRQTQAVGVVESASQFE